MKVNKIFSAAGEGSAYSFVSVDGKTFSSIIGMEPKAVYTTGKNRAGNGVRIFDVDGSKVFTCFNRELRITEVIMLTSEAVALGGRQASVVEAERANEPVLEFGE
jgi:hypothetical protein